MAESTELEAIQNSGSNGRSAIVWRNVNVYIKDKKNGSGKNRLKRIINNSTGLIQPGELMAVMGSR